jgi:hypothetical protein
MARRGVFSVSSRRVGTRCYVEIAKDLVQNEKTRINPDVCKIVILKIITATIKKRID